MLSALAGCLTLLEILRSTGIIFPPENPGNLLEVSWKFSGLVCTFVVYISYSVCISECISTKYLVVNQDQLILRLVVLVSVS